MTFVTWTPEMLKRFKVAVMVADIERKEHFTFDDHEYVVRYAKYLIEYLDGQFSGKPQ